MKNILKNEARVLYPGYFALVMATGIVSIASYLQGMTSLAWALLFINKVAYAVLCFLTLVRLLRYFPEFSGDLASHVRGPGFFTLVAGTCILGNQFVLIAQDSTSAISLFFAGTILWFILMYAFFTAVIVRGSKPGLGTGIHGGWLIAVVATQSVSVLGTLVAFSQHVLFFSLVMFLLGCMLYLIIITLVFYRLAFFSLTPDTFIPLYWVDMGAAAITTLAGGRLILASAEWPFLQEILPFLKGFTLFFWATATWWIPLLLVLSAWRHLRFPLRYDPQHWSLVFPLGMYTTSTFILGEATGLALFYLISRYFIYAALLAWIVCFAGMAGRIVTPQNRL